MVLQDAIKMVWLHNTCDAESWKEFRNKMMLIYTEAQSSDCPQIMQTIQVMNIFVMGSLSLHKILEHMFLIGVRLCTICVSTLC